MKPGVAVVKVTKYIVAALNSCQVHETMQLLTMGYIAQQIEQHGRPTMTDWSASRI